MTIFINKLLSFLFIMFIVRNVISLILIWMYGIVRMIIKINFLSTLSNCVISTILFIVYCRIDVINTVYSDKGIFILYSIAVFYILDNIRLMERDKYIRDYNKRYR